MPGGRKNDTSSPDASAQASTGRDRVTEIERGRRRDAAIEQAPHPADLRDQALDQLVDLARGQPVPMLAQPGGRRLDPEQRSTQLVVALGQPAAVRRPEFRGISAVLGTTACTFSLTHSSVRAEVPTAPWAIPTTVVTRG